MRKPDVVIERIGGEKYLSRWYLIPRNRWFNIYLHCFEGSDFDGALHDHPWWSLSFLLSGVLTEDYYLHPDLGTRSQTRMRGIWRFVPYFRPATHTHAMILNSKKAWTLFITGPRLREWGFQTDEGWVSHQEYLS